MEIWKDIPEYEGLYQASNIGLIRSVEGKTTCSKRFPIRHWKGRILKGRGDNPITGKRVNLWKNGKPKGYLVARLIAITFLGVPPEGFTVNHIDGNRFNNHIDNLEWLSRGDNIRHGFNTGLYKNTQKPITVFHEYTKEKIHFPSLACMDRFLKRHTGYSSERLKRHHSTFIAENGDCYSILVDE